MNLVYLAKVPILATIMVAQYATLRAPNPVPKSEDRHKFGGESDLLASIARWFPLLATWMSICLYLCEVAVIVAREVPSPLSDQVLSILLPRPADAANLSISPTFVIGSVLLVLGAVGRNMCYAALGRFFTFQLALQKEHKLVTTGPYAIVRHPSYTAFHMAEIGCVLTLMFPASYVYESGMLKTPWGVVYVTLWGVSHGTLNYIALSRIPVEDAVLRAEFGSQWDAWVRKTPNALIPYVF